MKLGMAKNDKPQYGAVARAHLLPPEVAEGQKVRAVRRLLFTGLVGAIVLVLGGAGAASIGVIGANSALQQEQSNTAGIQAQLSKYGKVTSVQTQVADIQSAQALGATGEISWMPYIASLQSTLPPGTTITAFSTELDSALTSAATVVPLQGEHVATLTVTADSPKASISNWLENLTTLKGYVSANPGSVALIAATGHYTVVVQILIDKKAFANRFVEGKAK